MKLQRKSKILEVRPYQLSDYEAWKNAHMHMIPEKQNQWDVQKKDSDFSKKVFKTILKTQKQNREKDYFYDFGVFLKDGTLVGGISLMDISRQIFQNAYLGYRIYNNHWGKGYGTEAVRLCIQIAFKDLNLHRLEAGIEPNNRRSIALAKSVGMKKESFSPQSETV